MNDEKVVTYASAAQCAQFGFGIALQIAKTVEGKVPSELIQRMMKAPEESAEFNAIVEEVTARILQIKTDQWKREKEKIEKFYSECFGIKNIDWGKAPIPASDISGMSVLEYVLAKLTEDQIFEAYAQKFGKDAVWKAYDSIRKAIKTQQDRPKGDYCILHRGGVEPDTEHLNKSYGDFSGDGNKYMVPKEGMLAAFRYRFETGKMYDVKGATRFHALDSGGGAMRMCRVSDGRFNMDGGDRGYRSSDYGPRQVSF